MKRIDSFILLLITIDFLVFFLVFLNVYLNVLFLTSVVIFIIFIIVELKYLLNKKIYRDNGESLLLVLSSLLLMFIGIVSIELKSIFLSVMILTIGALNFISLHRKRPNVSTITLYGIQVLIVITIYLFIGRNIYSNNSAITWFMFTSILFIWFSHIFVQEIKWFVSIK